MEIKVFNDKILINNRYTMYKDGTVYDTKKADDIPQWIFEFRDFVRLSVREQIEIENEKKDRLNF